MGFAAGCFVALSAFPARADKTDDDAKQAEELFKEARAAIAANDYKTACPKFEESLKLVRRAGTLFNLAQCEEHEGRLVSAMRYYKEGIVVLDPGDPRLAPSKKHLAVIEPRIPRLTIKPAADLPPESRMTIDGKDAEGLNIEIFLDPGEHRVAVLAPKREEQTLVVGLLEGEKKDVTVSAGAVVVEPPKPPPPPPPPVVQQIGTRRIVGLVVLGVGGLGFVGAAVTGGLVMSANAEVEKGCPNKQCNTSVGYEASRTGQTLLIANTVTWGVGILGAGVGTALLLYPFKKAPKDKPKTVQSIWVGPSGFGIAGSF